MKNALAIILIFFILDIGGYPTTASAHQPKIVETKDIVITNPEISKAYYGLLSGEPHIYTISAIEDFDLYVNVLVPDIEGQKKAVLADISRDGKSIAVLDANDKEWTKFFEPFGQSTYWKGPEYRARAEADEYTIRVWSTENNIKYSLAIGEIEAFDGKAGVNALLLIPDLKRHFFNQSPISFIFSPLGWGYIFVMYVFAFTVGIIYRAILKKVAKGSLRGVHKNIGKSDRIIRLVISVGLIVWAITTSWSPILLFFSGIALFEAIYSWCGFYAALGKNTCPVN